MFSSTSGYASSKKAMVAGDSARFIQRKPEFVNVPPTTGSLALWGRPSHEQVKDMKENEACTLIVTLQGESEHASEKNTLGASCEEFGVERMVLDFWKSYYGRDQNKNMDIPNMMNELAYRLKLGQNILIHCAAGIHRTGLMTYGILRMLGHDPQKCREIIAQIRMTTAMNVGERRLCDCEKLFADVWPDSNVPDAAN
jgi:protein tyrosine/serine phosphatase